jgi:hypothetical protein
MIDSHIVCKPAQTEQRSTKCLYFLRLPSLFAIILVLFGTLFLLDSLIRPQGTSR